MNTTTALDLAIRYIELSGRRQLLEVSLQYAVLAEEVVPLKAELQNVQDQMRVLEKATLSSRLAPSSPSSGS